MHEMNASVLPSEDSRTDLNVFDLVIDDAADDAAEDDADEFTNIIWDDGDQGQMPKKTNPQQPAVNIREEKQRLQMEGDPLHDLPAALEGGTVVAVLDEEPPEIDAFMNQYGIDTSKKKEDGLLASNLPPWAQWIVSAYNEAMALAASEDKALAGEASHRGLRTRLRILSAVSTDRKISEGTWQYIWALFRAACKYVSNTVFFCNFFGILIIANTIYMGLEVDNNWRGPTVSAVDNAFVTLYFVEIVIRISATDHFTTGMGFLYFDSAIVFASVLDMWIFPMLLSRAGDHTGGAILRVMKVFRICRLIRLARLLRLVHFLQPLRLMERSMRRAAVNFLSTMGFLTAWTYAASVIISFQIDQTEMDAVYGEGEVNYTSSVMWLMVYLFEAMISGYDWSEKLMRPLLHSSAPRGLGALIMSFMFLTKIGIATIITSSMVENYFTTLRLDAMEVEQEELYRTIDVPGWEQLLEDADENGDGRISWHEFVRFARDHDHGPRLLKKLGIRTKTKSDEQELQQLLDMRKVFQAMDLAGEESISIKVFVLGYVKLKSCKKDLEGLIMDGLLKQVMMLVRDHENLVSPLEYHLAQVEIMLQQKLQSMKYFAFDLEEVVTPVDDKLAKLEASFAQLQESLKLPDENCHETPAGAACVSSMTLHAEMVALKNAAEALIRSKGRETDALGVRLALGRAQRATSEDLPPSSLRRAEGAVWDSFGHRP